MTSLKPFRHCRGTLAALCVCAGAVTALADQAPGREYRPTNFSRAAARLPLDLRRVAVLPLQAAAQDSVSQVGCETLVPVLLAELGKTKAFEVIAISPEQLRRWTGRGAWTGDEVLPVGFFERLRAQTGCDAVLFAQLTFFHAYPPLAVGWKLRLVDCNNKQVLWAVDEILDANDPALASSALRHGRKHAQDSSPAAAAWSVLHSPRRFGAYTLRLVLATLPQR